MVVVLSSRESICDDFILTSSVVVAHRTARLFVVGRLVRVVFWTKIFYEQKSLQRFIRSKVLSHKSHDVSMRESAGISEQEALHRRWL